ncbi:hypothetical protein [Leptospira kirschneri]|uniref:Uncharacterized protein n=1 Tax=Leptospira kirschneri str. H1 TaxID=1049966 RepID=A0A0E2BK81_9LEPT|nr:hypothetical protein [Leptospira kirschneri]EKO17713.1 hypothetical protein LEP1GSC081_4284 [Leptospira kirschneri str. H1]
MNTLEYFHGQEVTQKASGLKMTVDAQLSDSLVKCVYYDQGKLFGTEMALDKIEPLFNGDLI